MDSMVGTALTIEREIEDARSTRDAGVSSKKRRVNLLQVRERSEGLLVHVGSRAAAIWARDGSELPVRLGRWCATIASSPNISGGIAPRDRDPKVLGQRSPSQRWDRKGYSIFLHSTEQARGANFSLRELPEYLLLHRHAREARLWAEVEDEAHGQGRQGFRGVSTPSHHRLSQ